MSTISPDEIVDLIANIRTCHLDAELPSPGVGSLVREAMRKTWFGKQPKPVHIAA
jgi:hypothetical protein